VGCKHKWVGFLGDTALALRTSNENEPNTADMNRLARQHSKTSPLRGGCVHVSTPYTLAGSGLPTGGGSGSCWSQFTQMQARGVVLFVFCRTGACWALLSQAPKQTTEHEEIQKCNCGSEQANRVSRGACTRPRCREHVVRSGYGEGARCMAGGGRRYCFRIFAHTNIETAPI